MEYTILDHKFTIDFTFYFSCNFFNYFNVVFVFNNYDFYGKILCLVSINFFDYKFVISRILINFG